MIVTTTSSKSMLLFLLSACISVIVILNLSYLPNLVSTTVSYTSSIEESVFSSSSSTAATAARNIKQASSKMSNGGGGVRKFDKNKINEWNEIRSARKQQQQPTQKQRPPAEESSTRTINQQQQQQQGVDGGDDEDGHHKIAGLNCDRFGGPSDDIAADVVYWRDIPDDAMYESPYKSYGPTDKYLTFEPDEGGWNNIRMSMETATTLAHAMGRTLVLPPGTYSICIAHNDAVVSSRLVLRHVLKATTTKERGL
jgi:GDP-fucose protein O-fucosyltransferase